jgi:MFS transporter, DHA1 family, tetracycline resistance protein
MTQTLRMPRSGYAEPMARTLTGAPTGPKMTLASTAPAAPGFWARNRALIAIFTVNFISLVGFGLMFPVFAIHGREIGASGWEIAGAVAAFSFGQFLSSPFWGRWSDRHGRKPVLVGSLALGSLVYLLHIWAETPAMLLAVRFVSGLATGSFSVAFAVASDISTPATRTRVMGVVGAGFSLGFIFGPAIGGFTASITGEKGAFDLVCVVGGMITLFGAAITWWMLPETCRPSDTQQAAPPKARELLRSPALAMPILISFVAVAAFAKMESVLTLFADDVLHLRPLGIGLMFGGMGTISTLTQLLLTGHVARWMGERGMLLLSLAIIALGTFLLGIAQDVVGAACGLLFTSIGFAFVNPALSALTSMAAPADAQGTAMGLMQSANALGRVLGPTAAGILYDVQGPASPFFWASGLLVLMLVATPFAPLPRGKGDGAQA